MLKIKVPYGDDFFDEITEEFIVGEYELTLEHSLASLSKWEAITEKPFISREEKSGQDLLEYIKAMTLTENVPDDVYEGMTSGNVEVINAYINSRQSATWFGEEKAQQSREIVTAELIYYWMIALNIPLECQYWHLNKLLTLIRVCNEKNQPEKELTPAEIAARNRALNEARRAEMKSRG